MEIKKIERVRGKKGGKPCRLSQRASPANVASSPHWAPTATRQRLVSAEPRWSPGTACTAGRKEVWTGVSLPWECYWHVFGSPRLPCMRDLFTFPKERADDLPLWPPIPPHPPHQLLIGAGPCGAELGRKGRVEVLRRGSWLNPAQGIKAQGTDPPLVLLPAEHQSCHLGRGGVKCLCLQC